MIVARVMLTVRCNDCLVFSPVHTGPEDFDTGSMRLVLSAHGWDVSRLEGGIVDLCPACAEKRKGGR